MKDTLDMAFPAYKKEQTDSKKSENDEKTSDNGLA